MLWLTAPIGTAAWVRTCLMLSATAGSQAPLLQDRDNGFLPHRFVVRIKALQMMSVNATWCGKSYDYYITHIFI